jgi:WD40 repeat protein
MLSINHEASAQVLGEGHFAGELKAICTHPRRQECFTAGFDHQLIHWNLVTHTRIKKEVLRYKGECIDIDPYGRLLAVGLTDGSVSIYNPEDFNLLNDIFMYLNPDKSVISILRFTPSGDSLVVAYSPPHCEVVIYDAYEPKTHRRLHCGDAKLVALDLSIKGDVMMFNNQAWELKVLDLKNDRFLPL